VVHAVTAAEARLLAARLVGNPGQRGAADGAVAVSHAFLRCAFRHRGLFVEAYVNPRPAFGNSPNALRVIARGTAGAQARMVGSDRRDEADRKRGDAIQPPKDTRQKARRCQADNAHRVLSAQAPGACADVDLRRDRKPAARRNAGARRSGHACSVRWSCL